MPNKNSTHAHEKEVAANKHQHGIRALVHPPEQATAADALASALNFQANALNPAGVLALQRTAGNRAVEHMLAQRLHRQPSPLTIQPSLVVGEADDVYEREADRVAKHVMRKNQSPRQSIHHEQVLNDKGTLSLVQPQTKAGHSPAEPRVEDAIRRSLPSGQALPRDLRSEMEAAFGADFSSVKLHTDREADNLNRSLEARAFTTGHDVFFRSGEYNPTSRAGQELIAHELTHVIQQNGGRMTGKVAETKTSGRKLAKTQRAPTSSGLIQTMKWPTKSAEKKDLLDRLEGYWPLASETNAKAVYAWFSSEEDFEFLIAAMTYEQLVAAMKLPTKDSEQFREKNGITDKKALDEYLKYEKSKAPQKQVEEFQAYDKSKHTEPSQFLKDEVKQLNVKFAELSDKAQEKLLIADINRETVEWERTKKKDLTKDQRENLNADKAKFTDEIQALIKALKTGMEKEAAAAKKEKEKKDAIDESVSLAQALPEYSAQIANDKLAKAIWDAAVKTAGKPGFVEVDKTVYKEAEVKDATTRLWRFSAAFKIKYPGTMYMKNPHCPGKGKVQNKEGHSSESARTSIFQADFIIFWGAENDSNKLVVHINADKASA